MAQLRTPGLQKSELLKACLVLPLRHLLGLTLCRKLVLEEGDFPCKTFSVLTSRGKCCGIFCLCSGYPLQCLSLCQSDLVLCILDTMCCAIPHRSGLLGKNLGGEQGHCVSGLHVSNDLSCSSHLCLQHGDICAALG
jgi:hypothetical protein